MESLSERTSTGYQQIHDGIIHLVDSARTETVRSVNALMTATYWEIGRRIVEFEQGGEARAAYGAQLIKRLSKDLSLRYKRGFSAKNLRQMRLFYLFFQHVEIRQTVSGELNTIGNSADTICRIPIGKDLADAVCQIERLFDISTAFVLHLLFSVCIFMQINEGKLP